MLIVTKHWTVIRGGLHHTTRSTVKVQMKTFSIALVILGVGLLQIGFAAQGSSTGKEIKMTKAQKGMTIVETDKYTIEIPDGWKVGNETPWGARDINPQAGSGKFGAMTAGPTNAGWDQLYKTSLGFIKREEPGTETPYHEGKTKNGYESMSFEVANKAGFVSRRYTLIRNSKGNVLALSIRIPSPDVEKEFVSMFKHMVDTAKLK